MLKDRFLKQMNLIKTTFEPALESMIIYKITFNDLDFIDKKCKLVDYKKNI